MAVIYNKSKTYLLPLLSEFVDFDKKFFDNLINTYVFENSYKYKDCIMILHDFSFRNPEYTRYEHQLTNNELFVDLIDVGNKVLYIFKFPEIYMHEYNKFIQGKYSEFGSDAKELILEFYTDIYKHNVNAVPFLVKVKQILFKDDKLRRKMERDLKVILPPEAELGQAFDEVSETFQTLKYENDETKSKIPR